MEKIEHKGYTIEIESEEYADSPDEWGGTSVFLVGFHRDFTVTRKGFEKEVVQALFSGTPPREIAKQYHIFPLEAYIHSGVSLYLANEAQIDRQWDVSQLGAVFVDRKEAKTRKEAEKMARGLIGTWNMYLSGDVWQVNVKDQDGQVIDGCGGFYGFENAKQSGIQTADSLAEKDAINPPMYKKEARAWLSVRVPELLSSFTEDKKLHDKMAQALAIALNNL
jgi:hypothetical protein